MAVIKQTPCINHTVLERAETATLGQVFVYTANEYSWTDRLPAWDGIILTKTARGFELIDENGRSHGIMNLGLLCPDPDSACTACTQSYVASGNITCITSVCCDQELFFGKNSTADTTIDWREFAGAPVDSCTNATYTIRFPSINTSGNWGVIFDGVPQTLPEPELADFLDSLPMIFAVADGFMEVGNDDSIPHTIELVPLDGTATYTAPTDNPSFEVLPNGNLSFCLSVG